MTVYKEPNRKVICTKSSTLLKKAKSDESNITNVSFEHVESQKVQVVKNIESPSKAKPKPSPMASFHF